MKCMFCIFLGRFGNGVVSFFLFLKWLMFLNLVIFFLEFGLVSLPAIVIKNTTAQASTNSCDFNALNAQSVSNSIADKLFDFVTGQVGILMHSQYKVIIFIN